MLLFIETNEIGNASYRGRGKGVSVVKQRECCFMYLFIYCESVVLCCVVLASLEDE